MTEKKSLKQRFESKRFKMNFIALSSTVTINIILSLLIGFLAPEDAFIGIGIFGAPLIGGLGRSALANKKDLMIIIPSMFILDAIIFAPIMQFAVGYANDLGDAVLMGLITGGVMVLVSLITLGIRVLIELWIKKSREKKN